jgi:hypothetical protein
MFDIVQKLTGSNNEDAKHFMKHYNFGNFVTNFIIIISVVVVLSSCSLLHFSYLLKIFLPWARKPRFQWRYGKDI